MTRNNDTVCLINFRYSQLICFLLLDLAFLVESLSEFARSSSMDSQESEHLDHIASQVRSRTLRCGVIGLTKAGKSTTLNALLGDNFLPASVQPQTAKKLSILHTPSVPDGELYYLDSDTDEQKLVTRGAKDVQTYLYEINSDVRENKNVMNQNLVLKAPFPFLSDVQGITLEVSDTPGLFEATPNNSITSESVVVVREQFAFVLIMNLKILKTQGESELLHMLSVHHPELFLKQSRILVLVNAYDVAFHSNNLGSIRPETISSYVSGYLAEPGILNITIPPKNILPFSAYWALKARLWLKDPSSLLSHPDAGNLYDESMIILRRAGYDSEVKSLSVVTKDNIVAIARYLLKFSKIEVVEERLKEMLKKQGLQLLLEAAIEDSLASADRVLTRISTKIDELELNKKEAIVFKHKEVMKTLNDLKSSHSTRIEQIPSSILASIAAEIDSIMNALREAIDTTISTQLTNHLQQYHGNEKRNIVFGRICEVKDHIIQPIMNEMLKTWRALNGVVTSVYVESVRGVISEQKSKVSLLLTTDATVGSEMPIVADLVTSISSQLLKDLDQVTVTELVSNFDSMDLKLDSSSIHNEQLNHIWQKIETRYRTEQRSKKKKSGLFGLKRKRVKWYENVPYQVHIYGPDINGLRSAFTTQATNPWMALFKNRFDTATAKMSKFSNEQVKKILDNVILSAEQAVQKAIGMCEDAEHNTRQMVNSLMANQHAIEEIKKQLIEFQ